jgi:aspartate aminotransferase
VYRDENDAAWVLPVGRVAEQALAVDMSLNKDYLPRLGFEPFTQAACRLLLGDECPQAFAEDRVDVESLDVSDQLVHRCTACNVCPALAV